MPCYRGQGAAAEGAELEEESREERERTREAAGIGLEEAARLMHKTQQHALDLKEQAREEQKKLAHERRLTFKQKARFEGKQSQSWGAGARYLVAYLRSGAAGKEETRPRDAGRRPQLHRGGKACRTKFWLLLWI